MNTVFVALASSLATNLLTILFVVGALGYAVLFLKSTQIIREKIWSFFVGDKDFNDERLKSFAREQLDLARFRVVYGVPAQSVGELHRLLAWMERYKVSPADVKRARGWIDLSRAKLLEIPGKREIFAWIILVGVLVLGAVLSGHAANSKAVWFKMNDSGTWFSSDGASVNAVWGDWHIDAQSCAKHAFPDTKVTGLTDGETASICNTLADGELKTKVSDSLRGQRNIFEGLMLGFLLFYIGSVIRLFIVLRVWRFGNRLFPKGRTSSQHRPPQDSPELAGSSD